MNDGGVLAEEDTNACCSTPNRWDCRILAALAPLPPPKNGYFHRPDLDPSLCLQLQNFF